MTDKTTYNIMIIGMAVRKKQMNKIKDKNRKIYCILLSLHFRFLNLSEKREMGEISK